MWHSRPPRDPPAPFMANAILNFHFDFLTPSLIKIGGGVFEGVSKSFKGQITIQESYGSPGKKWVLVYICAFFSCVHMCAPLDLLC